MIRFDNPFDISKDGQNPLLDGIRIHIRASADNKERIIEYIEKYVSITGDPSPFDILKCVMESLQISDAELTVNDEHDILDWIRLQFRG
jgi:hypothetical protein